jgi:protein phosphatase
MSKGVLTYMSKQQQVRLARATDTGCVREHNEDSFGHILPEDLGDPVKCPIDAMAVVADGMGGMAAGEVASDITVKTVLGKIQEWVDAWASKASEPATGLGKVRDTGDDLPLAQLVQSVVEANRQVISEGEKDPGKRGMGTTCTVAALSGLTLYIAHVGDSRAYLVREGQLIQITVDHSLVQEMVDDGLISPEEAWDHPRKNIVTRSIGSDPNLEVATYILDVFAGDQILLCSDGLNTMIRDHEIERIMNAEIDIQDKCHDLIRVANEAGGNDNTTVMVLAV